MTKGDSASVPAVEQCLFCHKTVDGENNPEIAKLLAHAGLDPAGEDGPRHHAAAHKLGAGA